jgi:thiosulfate sulfurtransferase
MPATGLGKFDTVNYRCISPQQAKEIMAAGRALVLDIRDRDSYAQAHMPGARHVDGSTIEDILGEADSSVPLIVCCYHGISSRQAAEFFASRGFTEVYSLDGGFELWRLSYP